MTFKFKKGDSVIPLRFETMNQEMKRLVGVPCIIFEVYHHGYLLSEDTRWSWLENNLKFNKK